METTTDPPVKKQQFFVRVLKKITPKFLHKYYTPEFITGWNISNYVTWAQATVVFKWEAISAFTTAKVWPVVLPILKVVGDMAQHGWKVFKEVLGDLFTVITHSS